MYAPHFAVNTDYVRNVYFRIGLIFFFSMVLYGRTQRVRHKIVTGPAFSLPNLEFVVARASVTKDYLGAGC